MPQPSAPNTVVFLRHPQQLAVAGCRVRYPRHWAPFALMAASAVPHAPFSIALHSMIGVSEHTRDTLRTLDVFFILTCGGETCFLTDFRQSAGLPGHAPHAW